MKIITLVVGQLQSNCYLVINEESDQAIIIDPGDDADYISQKLSDNRLKPTHLLATHGHFDHIMAVTDLQLMYNIPFLVHKKDEFLVKRMNETSLFFTGIRGGPPPKITKYITKNLKIELGNTTFSFLESPGHTPGGVCVFTKGHIFTGDLIFADGGVGRTDFSYSSPHQLSESIGKVLAYPDKTLLFPGHGGSTTVKDEKKFHNL
jgi:glyoxylase-like metal-dependent hydrolase (beta-lactamase superfamily II)